MTADDLKNQIEPTKRKTEKPTGKGVASKQQLNEDKKEDNSLTIQEAVEEARKILKQGMDEISQNIALESLRLRCGAGAGFWSNDIIKPLKRELQKDRFKLELKRIKAIDSRLDQLRELAAIAPQFSMSLSASKQALNYLEDEEKTPKAQCLSLEDLFNLESDGIDFLVNTWLPKGESLVLAGAPKSGKTLLAIDMAFAVATGESHFLGEQAQQGKVLIIQSDESPNSCKAKLLKRGFRPQDTDNLEVMVNWDVSQMSVLEEKLETFRPDLVIVDSLRRINAGSEISENSAEFADNLYSLKESFQRYGCASLILHHTSKDREAVGLNQVRGSSAIAGAVWGVLSLTQIPTKDEQTGKWVIDPNNLNRKLDLYARDTEGQAVTVALNPENNSYQLNLSEEEEQKEGEAKTLRERIMQILEANSSGLTGGEIVQLLDCDETPKGSVYTTLSRMVNKKLISSRPASHNKRYSIYFIPPQKSKDDNTTNQSSKNETTYNTEEKSPPPPPTPSPTDVICEAEKETQKEFQTYNTSYNTPKMLDNSYMSLDQDVISEKPDTEQDTASHLTYNTSSNTTGEGGQKYTASSEDTKKDENNHCSESRHSWYYKEGMKPYGTENDLPLDEIEKLVTDYLTANGETEEWNLIVAIGQKTPAIRTALDNIGAKRRRQNGRSSLDYAIYWSLNND